MPNSSASSSCSLLDFMQNFLFFQCSNRASSFRFSSIPSPLFPCLSRCTDSSTGSVLILGKPFSLTLKLERVVQSMTIDAPSFSRCTARSQISCSSLTCDSKHSEGASSSRCSLIPLFFLPACSSHLFLRAAMECMLFSVTSALIIYYGQEGGCVGLLLIREFIIKLMREITEQDNDRNFEVINNCIYAIKQEKLHPELLAFQKELTEELKALIADQRLKLKDFLSYEDEYEVKVSNKNFKYMIYNSEIEKIDYLLKTYLKTRLKKVQLYAFHLIKNEHQAEALLSEAEMRFLRKYSEMRYQYYKDNVFKLFVKNYRDFKGIEIVFAKSEEEQRERKTFIDSKQSQVELLKPNLNEFVFAEVLANPRQLRFGLDIKASNTNSEQMEVISPGSVIFGPYAQVQERFLVHQYRLI